MSIISPIIVDPCNYDKVTAAAECIKLINSFCDFNSIPKPEINMNSKIYGYGQFTHRTNKIDFNLKKCKVPVKAPGYSWSYTGYKADLTVAGVIAHEVGHYIDFLKGNKKELFSVSSRRNAAEVLKVIIPEKSITSYSGNGDQYHVLSETIAESMKLFILNPDLLREGRPLAYKLMTDVYGLKPVVHLSWQEVLVNANEKLIKSTTNWIKNKSKRLGPKEKDMLTQVNNELLIG
jgi:hypothetical protein